MWVCSKVMEYPLVLDCCTGVNGGVRERLALLERYDLGSVLYVGVSVAVIVAVL